MYCLDIIIIVIFHQGESNCLYPSLSSFISVWQVFDNENFSLPCYVCSIDSNNNNNNNNNNVFIFRGLHIKYKYELI